TGVMFTEWNASSFSDGEIASSSIMLHRRYLELSEILLIVQSKKALVLEKVSEQKLLE
ncbi:2853_t:CDS:1, partial [Acaulospora morrowiae]